MKFELIIVSSGFGNVPDATRILPPDGDGAYSFGGDHPSYGVTVEIPEGFEVAKNVLGEWRLWAPNGNGVDIFVYTDWDNTDKVYRQELELLYKENDRFVKKNARITNGVAHFH